MKKLIPMTLAMAFAGLVATPAAAQSSDIRTIGRVSPDAGSAFVMQWPGSGFETIVHGRALIANITDEFGDNYLNVEVDGVNHVVDLVQGAATYTLFSGAFGEHHVRVTRRNGVHSGATRVLNVRPDGRLEAPPAPERRILAIGGDTITGFGVEGPDQFCAPSYATYNHARTYPALAAKAFWADLQTIAVDGRGLVRSYVDTDPTLEHQIWSTQPWSNDVWRPENYQPQVVIIDLGVTDFTADTQPLGFAEAYDRLLRRIRASWPETEIFAAFGGSLSGERFEAARAAVESAVSVRRDAGDNRVHFVELAPTPEGRRFGCGWHPGIDANRTMADQVESAIRAHLGWIPEPRDIRRAPAGAMAGISSSVPAAH